MAFQRLLVIANDTISGESLHRHIHELTDEGGHVIVVAPALASRVKYTFSDIDRPREEARARVDASLWMLREHGVEAEGHVGDTDPVLAFEDAVTLFAPDAVLIATHPAGRENWLEQHEVEKIRQRTELPVEHVVVDVRAAQAEQRIASF